MFLWRHFADGVEIGDMTGGAELSRDVDDMALGEQRLQAPDDPTAGVQAKTLEVRVDANEVSRAVGKFENEARDRYAVVLKQALDDRPPELTGGAGRIVVEIRYKHNPLARGIELELRFCLSARTYGDDDAEHA